MKTISDEKKEKLKEETIKMYEKTISEMKERGIDTSLIESECEKTKNDYESKDLELNIRKTDIEYQEILMSNMFILSFFDVPCHLVSGVEFINLYKEQENVMKIVFRESKNFCVYDYIRKNKNKMQGEFKIEYIDRVGCVLRTDTYKLAEILDLKQNPLDYSSNKPITIEVLVKYDKHGISTK